MYDLTWKLFSETGSIETYLLLKELENVDAHQVSESHDPSGEYNLSERETELTELT